MAVTQAVEDWARESEGFLLRKHGTSVIAGPRAQHAYSEQIVHSGSSPSMIAHTRVLYMFTYLCVY